MDKLLVTCSFHSCFRSILYLTRW